MTIKKAIINTFLVSKLTFKPTNLFVGELFERNDVLTSVRERMRFPVRSQNLDSIVGNQECVHLKVSNLNFIPMLTTITNDLKNKFMVKLLNLSPFHQHNGYN